MNKSNKRNQSVALQLLKIVFSLYFLIALLTTSYQLVEEYRRTESVLLNELKTIEEISTPALSRALWDLNKKQVDQICKGIEKSPIVAFIEVFESEDLYYQSANLDLESHGILSHQYPLNFIEGEKKHAVGSIRLHSDRAIVMARVKPIFVLIILTAAIKTTILWLLLYWAFRKFLLIPLKEITEAAERVTFTTELNYHVETSHERHNEMSSLRDSLNLMLDRLCEQQDSLKEQVEQRTKDYRKAKEEAEQANEAKSEFLANMSHEIRTPMNAVLGFSEILQGLETNPEKERYLKSIISSGRALLVLINDILDLSKIEAGKFDLQYNAISLQGLCEEVEMVFEQKILEKGLNFSVVCDEQIPESLLVDDVRLRQVLINLIGNAIKFTERGFVRVMTACVCREEDLHEVDLTITVQDSGIGIEEEQQGKIFGAFEQSSGQKVRDFGGTGLGLAISLRLISLMGGTISLQSAVGKGSSFVINLPRVQIASKMTVKQDEGLNCDTICFEPAHVLIVDDVDYNRDVLDTYLNKYDFTIDKVADGKEALNAIYKRMPDLILLDMKMPGMDGYDVCCRLSQDASVKEIPVVAVTASALLKDREVINEYCDGYLQKPVSKAQVVKEIMKYLPYSACEPKLSRDVLNNVGVVDSCSLVQREEFLKAVEANGILGRIDELGETLTINEMLEFAQDLKSLRSIYPMRVFVDLLASYEGAVENYDSSMAEEKLAEIKLFISSV